jgi:hypothetical protein
LCNPAGRLTNNGVARLGVEVVAKRLEHRPYQTLRDLEFALARTPRAAGVSTRACYEARDADPEFAEKWSDAINKSMDTLEHAVFFAGAQKGQRPCDVRPESVSSQALRGNE